MKIKITRPIKVTLVGKTVLPVNHECEVDDNVGKVLVAKKYATEVKAFTKDIEVKEEKVETGASKEEAETKDEKPKSNKK